MIINTRKVKKLIREPKKFIIDGLDKKNSLYARKVKKLIADPSLFFIDYLNKRPQLKEKLDTYSSRIPLAKFHYGMYKEYKKKGFKSRAEAALRRAIEHKKESHFYYELGLRLKQKKQWWQAVDAFKEALSLSAEPPAVYYKEYANVLMQMNRYEEAAKAWESYVNEGKSKDAQAWFMYGYALELSGQTAASEHAYTQAVAFDTKLNAAQYGIGIFYEKRGNWISAVDAYKKRMEEVPFDANVRYRLALALDRCYKWEEAEKEYQKAIELNPDNVGWYYRLGFVKERQVKFKEAAEAYKYAVENKKEHIPYWYYRLGYTLCKEGCFSEAVEAFLKMKNVSLPKSETLPTNLQVSIKEKRESLQENAKILLSRRKKLEEFLSSSTINNALPILQEDVLLLWKEVLSSEEYKVELFKTLLKEIKKQEKELEKQEKELEKEQERIEASHNKIAILEQTLQQDTTRDDLWYKLAKEYEAIDDYTNAEYAYKRLIERKNNFDGNLYFALGKMLALQGKYKEASEAFVEQRVMQEAFGWIETPYEKDEKLKKIINYTEYFEKQNIDENIILYESYHGRSVSGNPFAFFKAILQDKRLKNFTHIWAINELDSIPNELKCYRNVIFVKRESDLYLRYLAKAKYLVNNTTFSSYFIRKPEQKYINIWHGTPIKYMGKDVRNEFFAHKNVQRNFLQVTHFVHPNKHTYEVLNSSHDLEGIFPGENIICGYPRQDIMINSDNNIKNELISLLGIEKGKKVVLYAPTWRGTLGSQNFDFDRLKSDLIKLAAIRDVEFLFKGHYFQENFIKKELPNINVKTIPNHIDTNLLLSIIDVLITDYSSIAFDFMALNKPILYYTYDYKKYKEERGLYFEIEDMGDKFDDIDRLINEIIKVAKTEQIPDKQKKAKERFCPYDDGQASKRLIEYIFFNNNPKERFDIIEDKKTKNNIFIYGGKFLPNGITTSLISLVNQIDKAKYNVTLLIEADQISKTSEQLEQFDRVDKNVKVISRNGRMNLTLEEKWVRDKFNSYREFPNEEMRQLYLRLHHREMLRIMGGIDYKAAVEFNGYDIFFPSLFASLKNNTMFLHNDMYNEWLMKFPSLKNVFQFYPSYTKLISASKDSYEANVNNLADFLKLDPRKFDYCNNTINIKDILTRANSDVIDESERKLMKKFNKLFINVARLSPEKGQDRLIEAFAKLKKENTNIGLIIIGDGGYITTLKSLIRKYKLDNSVFLFGFKSNPLPYIKEADCFVLSSRHEGQGLVLFEAMILNKPIISTDIDGPRSVLEGGHGELVENSTDGIYNGMKKFLNNSSFEYKKFDVETYNRKALEMFFNKVVNN